MNGMKKVSHSPYSRGAHKGIFFGIYLSCLFFATAYSLEVPFLGTLAFVLMLLVPILVYVSLRKSYLADFGLTLFSGLWLEGIMTFIFGGIISTFVATLFMQYIHPGFLDEQIQTMINTYSHIDWPRGHEVADMLERARDKHLIPRPVDIAVEMLWFMVFTGSLLSALMAFLVQARGYKDKRFNS
jgi:hypothetical protein